VKANSVSSDNAPQLASPIQSLNAFLAGMGVDTITGWRWRNKGWLETVNICGRVYVTQAQIQSFIRRAERGEFSQVHKAPGRARTADAAPACPPERRMAHVG